MVYLNYPISRLHSVKTKEAHTIGAGPKPANKPAAEAEATRGKDFLESIRRFRKLTAAQKIRATMINNNATRKLIGLGTGKFYRSD